MFRQRGNHCANILTDFGPVLTRSTENTENGILYYRCQTLCRARRTFSEAYY